MEFFMAIKTNFLTGLGSEQLKTEIIFFIVAARSAGEELLKIQAKPIDDEKEEARIIATVARILKKLKQQGKIQLFASSLDFDSSATEIEYLKNKYPDEIELGGEGRFFIVKL